MLLSRTLLPVLSVVRLNRPSRTHRAFRQTLLSKNMHALQERASWLLLMSCLYRDQPNEKRSWQPGCLLPELNPRQHMHLPARTGKSFGTLGRTKSNEFSAPNGGQKGDNLEKTNDSRMPILCSHAFACCGGSEPNLRFQPGWTTAHKCRFRRFRSDDRLRQL
jgi:hypothetical protein